MAGAGKRLSEAVQDRGFRDAAVGSGWTCIINLILNQFTVSIMKHLLMDFQLVKCQGRLRSLGGKEGSNSLLV